MDEKDGVSQSLNEQMRSTQQASAVAREVDLDFAVRSHVLANPELYRQAGKDIDATYSPEAFWQDALAFEKAQPCIAPDDYTTLEQWRSPAKRIGRIISEMLEHYRAFRGIPPVDRAAKVVLLHWILTDESCNTAPVEKLTAFQDWSKPDGADHELMHAHGYDYSDNADWREYVRKALAMMQTQPVTRTIADPRTTLSGEFDRFYAILEATTNVAANRRTIGPAPHAITLSQATAALHEAMAVALPTALASNDQTLMSALTSAARATGWPIDRHNRAQAGGWPHRWEPGEVIPAGMLDAIEQARKLVGIFPMRSGYDRPAPAEVLDAVRKVIADWDGTNWAAVRAVLEHAGQSQERIEAMTLEDVRQYFAVGQKAITLRLGGQPFTATNEIVGNGGHETVSSPPNSKELVHFRGWPEPKGGGKTAAGHGPMTWQEAGAKAEQHIKRNGGVFPGRNTLADYIVHCARSTMTKAINKSAYLKARQAEAKSNAKGVVKTTSLSAIPPDEIAGPAQDQAELARLVAEQDADRDRETRQHKARDRSQQR